MNSANVVSHGGRAFVAGLLWQPLSGTNAGDRQAEIKAFGKELDVNLYVQHREALCVGLIKTDAQIKAGALSLAAAVSDRLKDEYSANDFIFVCEIEDGRWYFLAQREGAIYPDWDKIVSSEDQAKTLFYENNSIGEWSNLIVPGHWGISGSKETKSLAELLPLGRKGAVVAIKGWAMAPISVTAVQVLQRHFKPLIIAALLIAVLMFGFEQFKQHQRAKAIAEAQRIAAEHQAQQKAELPRPRPWGQIPHAVDQMRACLDTLSGVRLFPGNWELAGVNCAGGVVVVSWKPLTYGWIEHLKQVVPDAVISTDGSLASTTKPLPNLKTGADEDLYFGNDRVVAMYAAAQRYGVKFAATPPVNNAPQVLPGQSGQAPEVQAWDEMGWKAEGVALPEVVLQALDGNGFRLRSMSAQWQAGRFVWTMEGTQYVRK